MKTSIFMSEEVKEQVMGRGKGEVNGLKGRQRRCRQGPSRSCLFPQKDSCRISAELRVLTLRVRQALAPSGRREGRQEQGYGAEEEMLCPGLSRVCRALKKRLSAKCSSVCGKQVPGATGEAGASSSHPPGSPHTLGRCWEDSLHPWAVHGLARGTDPQKMSPAHPVLCCPLGSEAEPDIAISPLLLGAGWDFHTH